MKTTTKNLLLTILIITACYSYGQDVKYGTGMLFGHNLGMPDSILYIGYDLKTDTDDDFESWMKDQDEFIREYRAKIKLKEDLMYGYTAKEFTGADYGTGDGLIFDDTTHYEVAFPDSVWNDKYESVIDAVRNGELFIENDSADFDLIITGGIYINDGSKYGSGNGIYLDRGKHELWERDDSMYFFVNDSAISFEGEFIIGEQEYEEYIINILIKHYDEYTTECYNDSVSGMVWDKYTHRQPTFKGFMEYLKNRK